MYKQQRFDFNQSGDSSIGLPDGPCALTELWSWGHNGLNQLGTNDEIDHIEPIKLNSLSTKGLIKIFAKENLSFAISSTYDIHVWGDGNCVTKVTPSKTISIGSNWIFQLNTQFPAYDISPPMILTESADRLGEVLKVSGSKSVQSECIKRLIPDLVRRRRFGASSSCKDWPFSLLIG